MMTTKVTCGTVRVTIESVPGLGWCWNTGDGGNGEGYVAVGFPTLQSAIADAQAKLGPAVRIVRHSDGDGIDVE